MSIKTIVPNTPDENDRVSLQRMRYDIVYQNAGDPNIYAIQCAESGMYHIICSGNNFASYLQCSYALENLREDDIPDLWIETDFLMVVSIVSSIK